MQPEQHTAGRFDHLRGALREFPPLIWSFLYFFFLLTGYYVMRPVRDAVAASNDPAMVFPPAMVEWFALRGVDLGEFQIQALFTGTFLSMLLLQPVYGALVSRFPRRVFLPVVYLVFIACLFGFYVAFDMDMPGRGGAYFIWVAVFNLFAVSVFWSFMADIYTDPEARRLYGFIAAGGTVGGLLGPEITSRLVSQLGVGNMLLVSAGFLGLCLVCILRLGPWARQRERNRGNLAEDEAMGGRVLEGLRRIAADPLLRALAFLMFFGVGVGTLLYNEQNAIVREMTAGNPAAAEQATAFFSTIDKWINWVVLVVQVFLTRTLLTRYGVAPLLLVPALAIMAGFCVLFASPLPMLVAVVQVLTRASEFSLSKPARETIYTRVDREARYKAKAAIDTVVYRGGDLAFAWLHKLMAAFGSSGVFAGGILVAGAFTASAWRVVREQARLPSDRH
ncbi:NTP/NDP exchange transporter [Arenimonas sp.]|uniref:NTP/NDP exchange transporter n=1 Tax=Arenimonas sp. TaxID=1872635 RepID=UPI002E3365ED|nr:MFS transporter [Arenimonas sp.]HEX4853328.1 MFS transporter [Arenimonas sp.]